MLFMSGERTPPTQLLHHLPENFRISGAPKCTERRGSIGTAQTSPVVGRRSETKPNQVKLRHQPGRSAALDEREKQVRKTCADRHPQ